MRQIHAGCRVAQKINFFHAVFGVAIWKPINSGRYFWQIIRILTFARFTSFLQFLASFLSVLNLGYPLKSGAYRWHHECGHITFPRKKFLCATPNLKCQPPHKLWNWSLVIINLVWCTRMVCNLRTRIGFEEKVA